MNLIPPTELPYGTLEVEEIYFEHDGPRFFALKSPRFGMRLLGFCVAEDEDNDQITYIYLVLSTSRFFQVRSGAMSLLDAFRMAEAGDIWEVIADYSLDTPVNRARPVKSVKSEWLPTENAFLRIPTPSEVEFDNLEFVQESYEMQRSLVAIELDPEQSRLTELPLRSLGQVSNYFQDVVNAVAQEEQGERTTSGSISSEISSEVQLAAVGMKAASFVLIIGVDRGARLGENRELVSRTLSRVTKLVNAATSSEALLPQLREYGPRARSRFRLLLQCAADIGSGLTVYTAPLAGEPDVATLTRHEVGAALNIIAEVQPTTRPLSIARVALTALNTSRHTFEVRDMLQGLRFSGSIAPGARMQANGIKVGDANYYSVTLEVVIDFASTDEQRHETFRLMQISALQS